MTKIELGLLIHQLIPRHNDSPECTVVFASCDDVTITCKDVSDLAFLDDSMVYDSKLQTITCGSTSVKVKIL